ncbi:threonine synthase [Patulibacter brassicae]|uniref:Threonine synthase n=1 Tax=Patulibacter brassicae TaxID=1705717 RepID=A0ABU4VGR9_9ACTN|nr:threonine synthase [Patulibacter brassicae]MDX8150035.1 threonine synthase [Patulibacter brassicae]
MAATSLICRECSSTYPLEAQFVCSRCFGPLEVAYAEHDASDVDSIRRRIQAGPRSIWRYADFLPLGAGSPTGSGEFATEAGLPAGGTPLVRADRLAERLGLREVWVKNDAANPTHSFKDRVVAVAAARAKELGFTTLACASTGNLAGAVAAAGAALGMPTYVFIPADLEEQKILSTGVYGANIVTVRGNYDDVNRLCTEIAGEREDWAFVNVNMRPYYAEGSKTLAYEIAEQLGWTVPDRIVAPIASGSLFTKIGKGFKEWIDLGLLEAAGTPSGLPAMSGAQAAGCNPVAAAFEAGQDVCRPVKPDTIAKSLAIGNPADGPYAIELARTTDGTISQVSDDEIREGIRLLAETTGIFTETAGGVTTATLKQLAEAGAIDPDERVVIVITGEGLKTLDVVRGTFECHEIDPRFEQFERVEGRTEVTV